MAEPTATQTILAGLLGGITSALSGSGDQVPAGTAAARPPVSSGFTIAGLSQKTIIIGLGVLIAVLMFMRKRK